MVQKVISPLDFFEAGRGTRPTTAGWCVVPRLRELSTNESSTIEYLPNLGLIASVDRQSRGAAQHVEKIAAAVKSKFPGATKLSHW